MGKPTPEFFTKVMGEIQGPFTPAQIRTLAQTGRLLPDSHIRKGVDGNWTTADRIKGLSFAPKPEVSHNPPASSSQKPANKPSAKRNLLVPILSGLVAALFLAVSVLTYMLLPTDSKLDNSSVSIASTPAQRPETGGSSQTPPSLSSSLDDETTQRIESPDNESLKLDSQQAPSQPKEKRKNILGSWKTKHGIQSAVVKNIHGVDVAIGFKTSIVYVPKNAADITSTNMPSFGTFFPVGYRNSSGDIEDHTGGMIPVGQNAVQFSIKSNDQTIVEVYDDGSAGFRGSGNATVTVTLADETISVPITVVELPLNSARFPTDATPVTDVVKIMGFPTKKTKHYFTWPDSEIVDGIYYGPQAGSGIATEHWTFDKYPGAVVAIVGNSTSGWVYSISSLAQSE